METVERVLVALQILDLASRASLTEDERQAVDRFAYEYLHATLGIAENPSLTKRRFGG